MHAASPSDAQLEVPETECGSATGTSLPGDDEDGDAASLASCLDCVVRGGSVTSESDTFAAAGKEKRDDDCVLHGGMGNVSASPAAGCGESGVDEAVSDGTDGSRAESQRRGNRGASRGRLPLAGRRDHGHRGVLLESLCDDSGCSDQATGATFPSQAATRGRDTGPEGQAEQQPSAAFEDIRLPLDAPGVAPREIPLMSASEGVGRDRQADSCAETVENSATGVWVPSRQRQLPLQTQSPPANSSLATETLC